MAAADGNTIDQVLRLFRERGDSGYGGEAVTQREHALQAAYMARKSGASSSLVAAALLHDVGHLLHYLPDDAPEHGKDDRHEKLGANWLDQRFGSEVGELVRLHVAAKRYLCATVSDYLQQLSGPSLVSLRLQGGPMSDVEVHEFCNNPRFSDAVLLRQWDEAAKIPNLLVPGIEEYVDDLQTSLTAAPGTVDL